MAKSKKEYKNGQVSFTIEELEAAAKSGDNALAYELLWKATTTSGHVKSKEAEKGSIDDYDDIYPISAEECDEMQNYLDQAIVASNAGAGDQELKDRIDELQDIIDWSRKRHWNFQWLLVAGCVITMLFMWYQHDDAKKSSASAQAKLAMVTEWAEADTTATLESLKDCHYPDADWMTQGCAKYQMFMMQKAAHLYYTNIKYEQDNRAKLDTASTEKSKKYLTNSIKVYQDAQKFYADEFDRYAKMDGKAVKEDAVAYFTERLGHKESGERTILFWFIYFIVLIPAYIFAERPYGWMESRHRTEKKVLGWVQKIGMWFASVTFGTGLLMSFLPDYLVETHYSSGRVERSRESNPLNLMVLGMKFILMVVGVIIFCATSVIIMSYATFVGLKRNYDWAAIFGKATKKVQAAA